MAEQDPKVQLAGLTERQREVLRLVCEGLDYKSVANELYIAEATVKAHMGNIYVRLALDSYPAAQRRVLLAQLYCPALQDETFAVDPDEPSEPEAVPDKVMKMIEEDAKAIVVRRPQPITRHVEVIDNQPPPLPSPTRSRRLIDTIRGGLIGVLLLAVVGLGVWWVFFRDGDVASVDGPIIVTTTPEPTILAPTQSVEEGVVVVTATLPPGTQTQQAPMATSAPPTNTSQPTATRALNTAPGTILEVGDGWRQDNTLLRLIDTHIDFDDCNLGLIFQLQNLSSSEVIVSVRGDQFSLEDNRGTRWQTVGTGWSIICPRVLRDFSAVVAPGEYFEMEFTKQISVGFAGNVTNPAVDYVDVTVNGLLSFDDATWRIPINN